MKHFRILWGGFCGLGTDRDEYTGATARRQIGLLAKCPDIARQVEMRSGRDRIARSCVPNFALIGIVQLKVHEPTLAIASFVLAILAIPMWAFFEGNSYGYDLRAMADLDRGAGPDKA